jgi:hypothetical protein
VSINYSGWPAGNIERALLPLGAAKPTGIRGSGGQAGVEGDDLTK